jgi:hypothetical protein
MHSRTSTLCALLLLICFSAFAITRGQLAARYGRAAWRQTAAGSSVVTTEQFTPEPGVALTARYDERGNVRQIRIAPEGPETDERGLRSLKPDLAEKILNQLIPRKQQPSEEHTESSGDCDRVVVSTGADLSISRQFHDCAPKGLNLTIDWR